MWTLIIPLVGPLQSWGDSAKSHYYRTTRAEPTKSGVLGLVTASLGRPRSESVDDLVALRFAVRVDRAGIVTTDYQTIGPGYRTGDGKIEKKQSLWTKRDFVAGAAFVAALEDRTPDLLLKIQEGLRKPYWHQSLGRKAFAPSVSPWLPDGLVEYPLLDALCDAPWFGDNPIPAKARVIVDDPDGRDYWHDVPISFAERRFAVRAVSEVWIDLPQAEE